mgnify:CR=1 FL=1
MPHLQRFQTDRTLGIQIRLQDVIVDAAASCGRVGLFLRIPIMDNTLRETGPHLSLNESYIIRDTCTYVVSYDRHETPRLHETRDHERGKPPDDHG